MLWKLAYSIIYAKQLETNITSPVSVFSFKKKTCSLSSYWETRRGSWRLKQTTIPLTVSADTGESFLKMLNKHLLTENLTISTITNIFPYHFMCQFYHTNPCVSYCYRNRILLTNQKWEFSSTVVWAWLWYF